MNPKPRSKHVLAAVVAIVASLVLVAAVPASSIAKKRRDRRVGNYVGITELGGTVSFSITRSRNVVNFTMPNVPVNCIVVQQGVTPTPYPNPPFTITAPPMKLQGVAKFSYEIPFNYDGPFQGVHVDGKPDDYGGALPPRPAPPPAPTWVTGPPRPTPPPHG